LPNVSELVVSFATLDSASTSVRFAGVHGQGFPSRLFRGERRHGAIECQKNLI
jgi:hypothetical protein